MIATRTTQTVAFPHLTPTIAINWLKAVGLLQLSQAWGYWQNDCFHLEIESAESLVQQILHHYKPKPFANPWNNDSLFGSAKGLEDLLASSSERYDLMRQGYQELQEALASFDLVGQSPAQKKLTLMAKLPSQVKSRYWLRWVNAVGMMTKTKKGPRFLCNELLGTGGNVGRTEFSTAYFQSCRQLWNLENGEPKANTEELIRAAVLGEPLPKTLEPKSLLGHTYPAADAFDDLAPSKNSAQDYLDNGGESSQLANPIDLILYLEGTATFTGKAIPRKEVKEEGDAEYTLAAYPLLLEVNSGTADTSDRSGRAYEVWLPLWEEPMDWEDFQELVTNDLAFRLKSQVRDTMDMLDIITQRDQQREGLSRFTRFGLWTRKGTQAKYLVYIGIAKPGSSDFGSELRAWQGKAHPHEKQAQAQYNLLTAIQKALYRLQQGNAEALTIIRLLGQIELLHSRIQANVPPVPSLSEQWVKAVYEEYPTAEVELAAALASTSLAHKVNKLAYSLRRSLSSARYSPNKEKWFWSDDHKDKLKTFSLEAFCISLLQLWNEDPDYHPAFGWMHRASPKTIARFIAGQTNDRVILELTLGFALCRIPKQLGRSQNWQPLPEPYKWAASLQWNSETILTTQTINGLLAGTTTLLTRQLASEGRSIHFPRTIATGKRAALALVFPCQPFYSFGETNA